MASKQSTVWIAGVGHHCKAMPDKKSPVGLGGAYQPPPEFDVQPLRENVAKWAGLLVQEKVVELTMEADAREAEAGGSRERGSQSQSLVPRVVPSVRNQVRTMRLSC